MSDKHERRPVDVLLVDDNPDAALIVREAIADSGMVKALHVVENGEAALDFLRAAGRYGHAPRPGFVLLDLNLPGKNGLQVLREMKRDDRLKTIPVIVMSSSRSGADIRACYGEHAGCYVPKPVDPDETVYVLKSIMHFWLTVAMLPEGGEGGP